MSTPTVDKFVHLRPRVDKFVHICPPHVDNFWPISVSRVFDELQNLSEIPEFAKTRMLLVCRFSGVKVNPMLSET